MSDVLSISVAKIAPSVSVFITVIAVGGRGGEWLGKWLVVVPCCCLGDNEGCVWGTEEILLEPNDVSC